MPFAPHHKVVGRWAAERKPSEGCYTRHEARRLVETTFEAAVLEVVAPVDLADLRVFVLQGDDDLPPAVAVICNSIGQIDMGWIEKSNVLRNSLVSHVAPVSWRATAYKALVETLPGVLPIFCYDQLIEELSAYYWDGEIDDEGARKALAYHYGADELDGMVLPSHMHARRPDFMLADNVEPVKHFPAELRRRLHRLRNAYKAAKDRLADGAWRFDFHQICEYLPELEECAPLPPLTLVPFDDFANEIDDVGRFGMEMGFMDVAGLCQLTDAGKLDDWFASLRLGVEVILAAQELIDFDPAKH